MYYHRVWADIDLDAAAHNLYLIQSMLAENVSVMVVVKANAYGHGAANIARHLENKGVFGFGVGDSQEALELREAGIRCPILILGTIIEDEIERVVKNGISVCIHSVGRAEQLSDEAIRQNRKCRVHLMVDTGMGRLGVFPDNAIRLAKTIVDSKGLVLEGVLTHCSSASDQSDPFTRVQIEKFKDVKENLHKAGYRPNLFHASNSGAIFSEYGNPFNMVRPGITIYGVSFAKSGEDIPSLKPVMSLKTQIIYMKDIPKGAPVGYDRLYVAPEPTRIATLPIGYNDGIPYRLSNCGFVLVHGRKAPIVGAVSMDYTMIDVGKIKGATVGDMVTIIGADGDERIHVEEIAKTAGTIPYEITCGIGKRVRRIAISNSRTGDDADKTEPVGAKDPGRAGIGWNEGG